MRNKNNICPCCGMYYFNELDSYEICKVCGWEDDPLQRKFPVMKGGANPESLDEGRKLWNKQKKKSGFFSVRLNPNALKTKKKKEDLSDITIGELYTVVEVQEAFGEKWYLIYDDMADGVTSAYLAKDFEIVLPEEEEAIIMKKRAIEDQEFDETFDKDYCENGITNPEIIRMYNNGLLMHKVIELATYAHRRQTRKNENKMCISHPFEVAMLLQKAGCDIEVIIAGLLHGIVEDADITLDEIKEQFGERVCELVARCSEDKTKSWKERKEHTLNEMMGCTDYGVLMLCCADKTANLRSMMIDYLRIGEELWKRYNVPREDILHYYSKLNDAFEPMLNSTKLYWENTRLYQTMFVKYYVDEEKKTMYQTNGEEAYVYDNIPKWNDFSLEAINTLIKENKLIQIKNEDAYEFEFLSWSGEIVEYYQYLEQGK